MSSILPIMYPMYLGDGSLNTTEGAYNNKAYVNKTLLSVAGGNYKKGNNNTISLYTGSSHTQFVGGWISRTINDSTGPGVQTVIRSGTTNYNFTASITGPKAVILYFSWIALSGILSLNGLKIKLNGNFYTLDSAVSNKLISPLIFILSVGAVSSSYVVDYPLRMYYGVEQCTGNYSNITIMITLNANVVLDQIQFSASKETYQAQYDDGFYIYEAIYSFDKNIIHIIR